jgi:NADH-quinone oxidoreductase subunit L
MAGPTPVSALIHAATMVTAGVYLIARTHALFALAPAVQSAVAVIGALTLLLAGCSALTQRDIKRVLAYSTISQIGYMFLALGVGAWSAAIFHLLTHAFFKALLFLAAGSVILSLHQEHDIFRMGGLRRHLPLTF